MKTLTSTILAVLLAVVYFQAVAQDERGLGYEPATVELEGRLVIQNEYGPPNYGETPKTDRKERVPVLVLAKPISVRGIPGHEYNATSVEDTRRIQLVFLDNPPAYKQLIGKKIIVKGSLFHAHTGHHYTPVLIIVSSLESKK
ncbi:MAG TPA: DUF4431 domain-containing protein [Pyrinomonadaceae bacterium]|nr:DUF4431 domain-containing protein [Pyrinomonadaceae bacterium]